MSSVKRKDASSNKRELSKRPSGSGYMRNNPNMSNKRYRTSRHHLIPRVKRTLKSQRGFIVEANTMDREQILEEKGSIKTTLQSSFSNEFFNNKMLIIEVIQQGISYDDFEKIKAISPFTDENWADYLEISLKSLSRYKKDPDFHFKRLHSEKIIELAEVTNFGEKVFGSLDKFYQWLQEPSLALGGFKPAELLKNSYGKELVMDELNRIEHGIFA